MSSTDLTDLGVPGIGPGALIGAGGTARVYRARQDALDRTVAVKILGPLDEAGRRRFDRERRAMGRLSAHRGIVTVYEAGVNSHGQSYVVMPLMERGSLQDMADQGVLDWRTAASLVADTAATIADAHDMSILHRDLKPGNVLVDDQGNPQVADFGLAHIVDSGTVHRSTQLSFTPGYVPPETLEGLPATAAGDVYSLGATFFALLAGRAPFVSESADGNILALALRVRDEPVPDLRSRGIPDEVCALMEASMDKNPSLRPTARQMSVALGALASNPSVTTDPQAGVVTVPDGATVVGALPDRPTEEPAVVGAPPPVVRVEGGNDRRRAAPVVFGLIAAAVVAVIAFVVISGGDDGNPVAAGDDTGLADDTGPAADDSAADSTDGDSEPADDADATAADTDGTADGDGTADDADGPSPLATLDPVLETTLPVDIDTRFPLSTDDGLFVVDVDRGLVARLDIETGDQVQMQVGARPAPLDIGGDYVWASNRDDATVSAIDPVTATVVATIDAGAGAGTVGQYQGLVYVPNSGDATITVIDPSTLTPVATIGTGPNPNTPAGFDGLVWVPNRGGSSITLVDPDQLAVVGEVAVPAGPIRPDVLFDRLWVVSSDAGVVSVFDPGSREPVSSVELAPDLRRAVAAGGLVWIGGPASDTVWALDPRTAAVVYEISLPDAAGLRPPQGGFGSLWIALAALDQVWVIDPATGGPSHMIDVSDEPAVVQFVGDRVAVPSTTGQSVDVIDPRAG